VGFLVRLTYRFLEVPFRDDATSSVRQVFQEDLGNSVLYRVFANFKSADGKWHGLFPLIYDTGAMITLLPSRMFELLKVGRYATATLRGISPKPELRVRLCKLTLKLQDENGNESTELSAWTAISFRDDLPFILGMKDLATKHSLIADFKNVRLSLDFCQSSA